MSFEERKEILESIKYIDLVYKFNDDDDSACNLINIINKEYKNKCNIFFGNGGDRTNKTTPEVEFCTKNNIEMIWGLGGGKIQSSSELLKKWLK
jgi:D-beta-D-heptose 7-phosphate kinase/D-beta-D-heptose 1-phosphate adenosyltransferase